MHSYHNLLWDVLSQGEPHEDRTGVGTRSVFGRQWRHDMRLGFPLLTTKFVPMRLIAEELKWFMSGDTNVKTLQAANVHIWDEWATAEQCAKFGREAGDLGPVYGKLWRDFEGTDQIKALLGDIETQPNSRRLIVTGWHPEWQREVALPPCHTLWQVKCHPNRQMSLSLYARSIDIFLGLPFDIALYAMLLKWLCVKTGYQARDLVISFGDLHLYNNHVEQASVLLSRQPYELPTFEVCEDLTYQLSNYRYHPKIEAPVAV